MATNDASILSSYRELTMINTRHGISLVQHIATGRVYALKTLDVYNAESIAISGKTPSRELRRSRK